MFPFDIKKITEIWIEYVSEADTFGIDRDFIFQNDHLNSRKISPLFQCQ